ncbi:MAG TPA: hypothetical protein PKD64_09080 [Pirellulaceae bacterium]|nr:hypothetical protein [Pirellulaceae bacterium]HMO92340.1 hypothetical protein [Pirellulaceae bacterium]HMP69264.1 hypothetical protein [Pirellulaceae bacterium]
MESYSSTDGWLTPENRRQLKDLVLILLKPKRLSKHELAHPVDNRIDAGFATRG